MDKRPTISDVAKLANVSIATVSHVINGTRFVTDDTRKLVINAIEQLNYRPSALAKGLASNRTRLVGVVLSDINNPLFRNIFKTIESELFEAEYDLILANTGEDVERQHSILEALLSRQVDGLIVAPNYGTSQARNPLHHAGIPVVMIDRLSQDSQFPTITVNNEQITYEAIRHLISDGHERIAFIGGLMDAHGGVSTVAQRLQGFRRAMEESELQLPDDRIFVQGKARQSDGYAAALQILQTNPRPTALFTTNILLLLGVLQALQELRLRCPEDIGLISFDHDHWTDIYMPPITLIKQPTDTIGVTAVRQLISMMTSGSPLEESEQDLACEFLVRGSCSPQCLHDYLQKGC
jgi:LacI family transcriptional regulator